MVKNIQRVALSRLFFMFWATFCITVFIFFSGRVSVLHSSVIFVWGTFIPKLALIPPLNYMSNIITSLAGISIFTIACTSLGTMFSERSYVGQENKTPNRPALPVLLSTAFLIGNGLFSIVFLILGGYQKLTFISIVLIMLGGGFSGLKSFIKLYKTSPINSYSVIAEDTKGVDRLVVWLSISIILLSLMFSSSRLSYDSVALYFSDAKITALTNSIQFFLNDSFIISSFHTGIQYAVVFKLFGDQAARMYSWVNGLIIIVFTLALGEQLGLSKQARRILLAILLTTTAFTDLLGDGKIDLATTAPAIAAIYWMSTTEPQSSRKYLFLTGFFAGFAIISRPFNAFLLGVAFPLYYLQQIYLPIKKRVFSFKPLFNNFFWFLLPLLGLAGFHLFANWLILGSPLAPLTNAAKLNTSAWQWSFDPDQIWAFRAFYPFVVTFINSPQSLGNISPLFLAFTPWLFVGSIRENLLEKKSLINLTIIAAATLLLWVTLFFTVVEIRYVLFLWLILFLPLAVIVEKILDLNENSSRIMQLLLIIVLLFANFRIIYISLDSYSPVDKQGNPHCFNHLFCDYLKPINESAPYESRVLTLNAYRYYLRSDLFACSTRADEYTAIRKASLSGPDKFWLEVHRQGYTYIAFERNYFIRHLYMTGTQIDKNIPEWIQLEKLDGNSDGDVASFKINYINPPGKMETNCAEINKVWSLQSIP